MEYSSVTKKTDLESASKKKIKILLFSIFKMTVVKNFTKVFHSKNICQRLCLVDSYRIFAIYQKTAPKSARRVKVLKSSFSQYLSWQWHRILRKLFIARIFAEDYALWTVIEYSRFTKKLLSNRLGVEKYYNHAYLNV